MNSLDKMEDYDRLARLAEKQDSRTKELEGMVALQADALTKIIKSGAKMAFASTYDSAKQAISATAETVSKYKAELTEPLRMEVAALYAIMDKFQYNEFGVKRFASEDEVNDALHNTKATAQAYEGEVKVKALEEAADWYDEQDRIGNETHGGQDELRRMAQDIRATSKKG